MAQSDSVNIMCESVHFIEKNGTLLVASKEIVLECCFTPRERDHMEDTGLDKKSFYVGSSESSQRGHGLD